MTYIIYDIVAIFQELQAAVTHTNKPLLQSMSLMIYQIFSSSSKKAHTEIMVMSNLFKYKD